MEWKNCSCSKSHFKGCRLHVFTICVFVELDEVLDTRGGDCSLFLAQHLFNRSSCLVALIKVNADIY